MPPYRAPALHVGADSAAGDAAARLRAARPRRAGECLGDRIRDGRDRRGRPARIRWRIRLRHLDDARARDVLDAAARMAGWRGAREARRAAASASASARYKDSGAWCAVVAEIEAGGAHLLPPPLDRRRCGRGDQPRRRRQPVSRAAPSTATSMCAAGSGAPSTRRARHLATPGNATRSCASPRCRRSRSRSSTGRRRRRSAPARQPRPDHRRHRQCHPRRARRARRAHCPSRRRTIAKARMLMADHPDASPARSSDRTRPIHRRPRDRCRASTSPASPGEPEEHVPLAHARRAPSRSPSSRWAATSSPPRAATAPISACRSSSPAPSATPRSTSAPTAASRGREDLAGRTIGTAGIPADRRRSGCAACCATSYGVDTRGIAWLTGRRAHRRSRCRRATTCADGGGRHAGRDAGRGPHRRLHRPAPARLLRQRHRAGRAALGRSARGGGGLSPRHRLLPDHALHRHPPRRGRGASLRCPRRCSAPSPRPRRWRWRSWR